MTADTAATSAVPSADAATIGAVILAAGFGRRFGADKRLARFKDQTVAGTTVSLYRQVFEHVRVVLRPEDDALRAALAGQDITIVTAADAKAGMGHSLAAGVTGLAWRYAFVALADMPFLRRDTLATLAAAAEASGWDAIVRPHVEHPDAPAQTHPVGLPADLFEEARASRGDQGARALLARHTDRIVWVAVDDHGVWRDIDRPEDIP